ncbi:GGDEF domain-containing protein [Butyrivibrio fibrisolvens]|uniref:sensor domain-containing diguanylate cyclase n=1 Tax=Pseudobutyrivibrio ruminis TaxID=46206 RepID=UPI00040407DC|nr:diguanylate cyclase [Pseudobutyrivibrio ruminis]MDC7278165.1 GGDEF domain-containing protein [Butyrivibrio fibrisolvens]
MKQYNYEISSISKIAKHLKEVQTDIAGTSYSSALFHIYSIQYDDDLLLQAQQEILKAFPDAIICGTSSNGAIFNGQLSEEGLILAISIFESTEVKAYMVECERNGEVQVGNKIKDIIDETEGITAAEIFITLKSINSTTVLNIAQLCKKDVIIFGGGSADVDISGSNTKVIVGTEICHEGVALITYSGENLNIDVHHAIGWKPLGKEFLANKIEGKRLYELNNIPAGEVYRNYLDIHADESFFDNILEFPIMSKQHGFEVMRLPFSCNDEDKSIILAASIDRGTPVQLSYGDPDVIQSDVRNLLNTVTEYAPQAIFLYSCGVRRLYWKYLINKETSPFAKIAPVAGFYSSGEIMRMDNYIIEHHVTLIAISMREGDKAIAQPTSGKKKVLPMSEEEKIHGQISMVRRLANFINVTSAELQEANEQLQEIADTDSLTGFYNRRMLDRLVHDALHRANKYNLDMTIGIIDIDDFKLINDTYGHDAGDHVLIELSKAMYAEVEKLPSSIFGRWGGEEFLFLAPTLHAEKVFKQIENARKRVSSHDVKGIGVITISLGITSFRPGDDYATVFKRADEALYKAKTTGKNKTCIIL